jgi:glucose-6-phosphate isomerase
MNKLQHGENFIPVLGKHEIDVIRTLQKMDDEKIIERIWKKDFTVWGSEPKEIADRLDWLDMPLLMKEEIENINSFVNEIKEEGFENALLLGMGGSSLAPEVFRFTFGVRAGFLNLEICDSTHPENLISKSDKYDPAKTLYIVSTKSGGTIETISFMKYFYNFAGKKLGFEMVKKHFVAITDPGSGLENIARELGFRKIFLNNPNIGGRFSALSFFGLVPAALLGINLSNLLERADRLIKTSMVSNIENIEENTSATIGLILGALAEKNINKLSLCMSEQIKYLGAWVEQLIAESTGKVGKGILPVDGEKIQNIKNYSKDRLFVFLVIKNDKSFDKTMEQMKENSIPFVKIVLNDIYEIGAEFFRWEFATSVAGWLMKIQPFDQPNVESAKVLARKMIADYKVSGKLVKPTISLTENEIELISDNDGKTIREALISFIDKSIMDGSYFTIQAFVNPNENNYHAMEIFRNKLLEKYLLPTTSGFGPRFLHSTGQLHKGDSGKGIFIQFMSDITEDVAIPDNAGLNESSFTFGTLITAQALGDREALINNNRNVITFNIRKNVAENIKLLAKYLE